MASLFLCSEEMDRPELPVACSIRRFLSVNGLTTQNNKAALIITEHPIYEKAHTEFVVVAKGDGILEPIARDEAVGVYVFEPDSRLNGDLFDLSGGLSPVVDWAALTSSAEAAAKWQVRKNKPA